MEVASVITNDINMYQNARIVEDLRDTTGPFV
jgi:hypothetical protein